jgi:beta-xylosidase
MTRLDFDAKSVHDEAGLIILRGDEKSSLRLYSSVNATGKKVLCFRFDTSRYETANIVGDTVWLKMVRMNHSVRGYFSGNGHDWKQVGQSFTLSTIDAYSDYTSFTGTRQGLYVQNRSAYFDFYIYRDAYTPPFLPNRRG